MEYKRMYAKIDLDSVGKNVKGVRDRIPCGTRIMAVIKANAYGHGAVTLAKYLDGRVEWYGVANIDEALELRNAGIEKEILVLGCLNPLEYRAAVENDITVTIASLADAEKLSKTASGLKTEAKCHIKLDTGMSRIGFQANDESVSAVKSIAGLPSLKIGGIFTHFALADSKDKTVAEKQREIFDVFTNKCEKAGVVLPVKHVNNSAATMELDRHYDMVRMGIMLYGLYPSEEMDRSYPLYPAMSLISHISFIKELEKGRGISYGHTYITDKNTVVATVPCGYADGYPRCLSGRAEVLIRGVRCPILGRICMDQMMVDVTHVPGVNRGDEVVLVGRSGDEFIPVEEIADNAFSFNYEFVCGVSRRVPRVYFENGEYKNTVSYLI
ncbi:MAG: alanine racemase [Clostridia bacterium]|nr:alanine racemase [Clostridia bacterium]